MFRSRLVADLSRRMNSKEFFMRVHSLGKIINIPVFRVMVTFQNFTYLCVALDSTFDTVNLISEAIFKEVMKRNDKYRQGGRFITETIAQKLESRTNFKFEIDYNGQIKL